MQSTRSIAIVLVTCIAALFALGMAPSRKELQRRFKERLPEIQSLKADGVIGETWDGYLDPVKGRLEKSERRIVNEENDDRRDLYRLIGDEEGTRAELVGQRNASRVWRNARPGEYFKERSGDWKRKGRGD